MALSGLRVLDVSVARAGPSAVRQLAEFGAVVTRIEIPDDTAGIAQDHTGSDYINLHGNKRVITLDLKSDQGREIFFRLLTQTDVLVENFRPPVKKRLGISYDDIALEFPRLVYGSISGFGQDGPIADKGAVDQVIQGYAGLMSITGTTETGPLRTGIAVADMAAGAFLVNGILLALMERERTGLGQWVKVSLLEAMLSFLDFQAARWTVDGVDPGPVGNDHPTITPMGTFLAADGYLNVAAPNDRLWLRLCSALGADRLLDDPDFATVSLRQEHKDRLKKELQSIFVQRPRVEWVSFLDEVGVPCGPVNTVAEVFAEPQVVHLGMRVEIDHPARGRVGVMRSPISLSRSPMASKTPSPMPSQHSDEILAELGYSVAEVRELRERRVV